MKTIVIPFDLERAKRIQEGKEEGKITTKNGCEVKIIYWNLKNSTYCFVAIIHLLPADCEICKYYDKYGHYDAEEGYESDIDTLVLQVPQYEDGDILVEKGGKYPFIFKNVQNNYCKFYAGLDLDNKLILGKTGDWCPITEVKSYANEEQKQQLINALQNSKEFLAKEYLKRFFNIEEFQPFDKVLVRKDKKSMWIAAFFSHTEKEKPYSYIITGDLSYNECIHYNEETKHLIGTNKSYK